MEQKAPVNTEKEAKENPMGMLARAMFSPTPIEDQESQGQKSFVSSDTLPAKMDPESKSALESAGVKFGELVKDDPLFRYVELPQGWKKIPTEHSMWSSLIDKDGKIRADIFYKAAFYDRRAFISVHREG